jgi:hypothetical protein
MKYSNNSYRINRNFGSSNTHPGGPEENIESPRRRSSQCTYILILGVIFALVVAACGPDRQTGFQGLLLDSSGRPINGIKNLTFRYFSSTTNCTNGTNILLTETQTVSVANGLLNVMMGSTIANNQYGLNGIDPEMFAQPLFMSIEIDGEKLLPCQKLMGAPYAMSLAGGAVVGNDHEGNGAGGSDITDANYGSLSVAAGGSAGTALVIGSNGGDLIRACSGITGARTCGDLELRVTGDGNVRADGSFFAGGADFAELVSIASGVDNLEPGDVLAISPDVDRAVVLASEPNSTALMGVYSTKAGFVGSQFGAEQSSETTNYVMVAIMGIVPVKVSAENGPIHRGDLLTTSATPGHAMKATSFDAGTLLGKAMGELESGTGIIEVFLVLR